MRVLYEAVLGSAQEGEKVGELLKKHKKVLAVHAKEQPAQLAQLIALEHYLSGEFSFLSVLAGACFCSRLGGMVGPELFWFQFLCWAHTPAMHTRPALADPHLHPPVRPRPAATAPERAREAPLALKALYDEDLAEEGVILAWAGKADACKILGLEPEATKAVRKAAQPFVDWLQEEEDSDEEEEEDEE